VIVLLGGCFHSDYYVSGTTPVEEAQSEWRHRLLLGLIDLDPDTDLRAVCPQGVSHIEEEMEVGNVILFFITLGIYSPSTIDIWCQQPPPPVQVAPPPPPAAPVAPVTPPSVTPPPPGPESLEPVNAPP
jgi:hypothetical protein